MMHVGATGLSISVQISRVRPFSDPIWLNYGAVLPARKHCARGARAWLFLKHGLILNLVAMVGSPVCTHVARPYVELVGTHLNLGK